MHDVLASQEFLDEFDTPPDSEGLDTPSDLTATMLRSASSASLSSLDIATPNPLASNAEDVVAGRSTDAASAEEFESGLRGAWRKLTQALTPGWMTPRTRGLGLLWLLVALCATNWVLVKDSGGLDAFTFSALRFTVAAAAFSPFLPQALLRRSNTLLPAGIELGIWTSAGYLTQALGLMTTDASRASFISTFTVLAVPFLASSRLGDGRPVKWTVWVSALVALAGVSLLEEGGGSPPGVGDLWSLASAIFFGIQIFRTEKLSRKLPPQSTFQLMSLSLATVAGISLTAAAIAHPSQFAGLMVNPVGSLEALRGDNMPWGQVLWTGLLSTDLALILELTALGTVSSIDASIIYTAEPVMGAALAFVVLGERWGPTGWWGAALIVASSLAAQLTGGGEEPSPDKTQ